MTSTTKKLSLAELCMLISTATGHEVSLTSDFKNGVVYLLFLQAIVNKQLESILNSAGEDQEVSPFLVPVNKYPRTQFQVKGNFRTLANCLWQLFQFKLLEKDWYKLMSEDSQHHIAFLRKMVEWYHGIEDGDEFVVERGTDREYAEAILMYDKVLIDNQQLRSFLTKGNIEMDEKDRNKSLLQRKKKQSTKQLETKPLVRTQRRGKIQVKLIKRVSQVNDQGKEAVQQLLPPSPVSCINISSELCDSIGNIAETFGEMMGPEVSEVSDPPELAHDKSQDEIKEQETAAHEIQQVGNEETNQVIQGSFVSQDRRSAATITKPKHVIKREDLSLLKHLERWKREGLVMRGTFIRVFFTLIANHQCTISDEEFQRLKDLAAQEFSQLNFEVFQNLYNEITNACKEDEEEKL